MRKKIFAILMSAMMMVTFMPAMAFAQNLQEPADAWNGFTVSNVSKGNVAVHYASGNPYWAGAEADMVYDGQTHEVTYNPTKDDGAAAKTVVYSTFQKKSRMDDWKVIALNSATAPSFKDAGYYLTVASVERIDLVKAEKPNQWIKTLLTSNYTRSLELHIYQRPVVVLGNGALNKKVVYNGKKVGLTDADFTILPCYNKKTGAFDQPLTGLCAGDTLITKSLEVGPDAGTYPMTGFAAYLGLNPNYRIFGEGCTTIGEIINLKKFGKLEDLGEMELSLTSLLTNVTVTIEKADPTVKVTSNTLTIKRGKSKAVKFSTNFGTAKLTKLSGNAKINLKNGKLYVKKGLKKGTYKVKVKAAVAASTNWTAASRTKTLTIKVK